MQKAISHYKAKAYFLNYTKTQERCQKIEKI